MNETTVDCQACEVHYTLAFDDEEADVRFCPFCGTEILEELNFNE